jgi:hypothetical protein
MYDVKPNLIIGFHGCEAAIRDSLLKNPDEIKISQKPFDWLGHGLYFWENNYERALLWAQQKKDRGAIKEPAVIGAVLYIGYCCDFLDSKYLQLLARSYAVMEENYRKSGKELPSNKDLANDPHKDKIMRHLDCATIEFMHAEIFDQIQQDVKAKGFSDYKIFDTVRGVFTEGSPVFSGAGLFAKSHIQICIRNPNCIKGFFLPRKEINFTTHLHSLKPDGVLS